MSIVHEFRTNPVPIGSAHLASAARPSRSVSVEVRCARRIEARLREITRGDDGEESAVSSKAKRNVVAKVNVEF